MLHYFFWKNFISISVRFVPIAFIALFANFRFDFFFRFVSLKFGDGCVTVYAGLRCVTKNLFILFIWLIVLHRVQFLFAFLVFLLNELPAAVDFSYMYLWVFNLTDLLIVYVRNVHWFRGVAIYVICARIACYQTIDKIFSNHSKANINYNRSM